MLDKKALKELQDKHGRIAHVDAPDGRTVVVRKPSGPQYRAFVGKLSKDGANKETAIFDLVRECVVHPEDEAALASILDEFPAITLTLGGAITELAGGGVEATVRKN